MALAILLGTSVSAFSNSFEKPPRRYGELANRALMQVGSDLRFSLNGCDGSNTVECRFSAGDVTVLVQGRRQPSHTTGIILEADLLQEAPAPDPAAIVTDVVLAFGATMVIFDPGLAPERRVQLLTNLTDTALSTGRSEATGEDARYSVTFDEAAGGAIIITVAPAQ